MHFLLIRNRDKKGALSGGAPAALLMLKVILDCVSRILIFSSWLYVVNNGMFSSVYTLAAYYTVFGVLVIFNIITSDNREFSKANYWIGLH